MNYLSIDVGTTCCKCQLFSDDGKILKYLTREYGFIQKNGYEYVDALAIAAHTRNMIFEVSHEYEIASICISSLGEAFVLLDKNDNIIFSPMLYTDPRGEDEAKEIAALIGEERIFRVTGTIPHSMYSISKLLFIKKNYPEIYDKAEKLLLIGDYVGYLLTGERVIDYGLAARTGVFDVENKCFDYEILNILGIDEKLFSTPRPAGIRVGTLKEEWGLPGTVLILGSHDQVCSALGAGALSPGDAVDGMGTVECITVLFDKKPNDIELARCGYPCVPYAVDGLYCTYILSYSCGSLVNWFRNKILHGYSGGEKNFFAYAEKEMPDKPSGILTLPYINGASTPYQDINARGAIINISSNTSDIYIYRSILEGTAMEMRLNADKVNEWGIRLKHLVATGGGANSDKWLQIKSDIQNLPIKTLRSSEGGLCGCAMLQATSMGSCSDLFEAKEIFVRYNKKFFPSKENEYDRQYEKYKKLYQTVKELIL